MHTLKRTRLLPLIVFFLGISLTAKPTYYYMKGICAQLLLEKAWSITKRTGNSSKAWSWADTLPVAKLQIPIINLNQIVLGGEEIEAMAFGPAIIESSLESSNVIIAGHRDSFFRNLGELIEGDIIKLEKIGKKISYKISNIIITDPLDIKWLKQDLDDRITLITCYPFNFIGEAPMRYILVGKSY